MEKCEFGRKSTRTVPVIIENHENITKKTKLMVPSNYTAGHLVNVLRSRMHLRPYHPVYLFLKSKQSPVLMSKSIGHLHHKYRDEKGLLRLIQAEQTSFGFRGNIRAIRFRQKWIENLHNTMHQDAGGPSVNFSAPPPYFPVEPPSTSNFGAPLDDMNDPVINLTDNDDYYDYMANSFMLDMEESLNPPINDTPPAWLASIAGSSQHPAPNNTIDHEVAPTIATWAMSSSVSDPWLPSTATNSSQIPGTSSSFVLINDEEEINQLNLQVEHITQSIIESTASVNADGSIPTVSVQHIVMQNPQPAHLSLYESDSDFYDSDKDVEMDE